MAARTREEADELLARMMVAQREFMDFDQERVDRIFEQVAQKARLHAFELAKLAVEESGIGMIEDKVLKNLYAAEYSVSRYRDLRTVGVIEEDPIAGISKIGEPVGPIAAVVPCTNPTSTTIITSLYALKTRNTVCFLGHPRTKNCTAVAANLLARYAEELGAPKGCIAVAMPSHEISEHIMKHTDIRFILATGGPGMVRASYKSGKPAIGVGAGNAPALVDGTYDLREAINSIVMGKTFDNGTICASEQSIIIMQEQYEEAKELLRGRGVHILDSDDKARLAAFFMPDGKHLNPDVVGKSALHIARESNINVPEDTVVLCVEASEIGPSEVFSYEKLSPIIALYAAPDFEHGLQKARCLTENGGIGHTAVLYTDPRNVDRISRFQKIVPAFHLLVNTPTSLGTIGIKYTNLDPSLTLGVGTIGGSSSSLNVGPREMLNVKTVAHKVDYPRVFSVPTTYSGKMCIRSALDDVLLGMREFENNRDAVVVADPWTIRSGTIEVVSGHLRNAGFRVHVFSDFQIDPTIECVEKGTALMDRYRPLLVLAIGGNSAIDAAKLMRLHYEYPLLTPEKMVSPFLEMASRNIEVPTAHKKIRRFIAVPTTFTGSEANPVAEVRIGSRKLSVCSYSLVPDLVVRDPQFLEFMPPHVAASSSFAALAQAIESFVSVTATRETQALALDAVRVIYKSMPEASGVARDELFYAAGQAGMAFGNTLLGTASSMAMRLGTRFGVLHGEALGIFLPHVILHNATDRPCRLTPYPGYPYPKAIEQYAHIADALGIGGDAESDQHKVSTLVIAIEERKRLLGLASCVRALGVVSEEKYMAHIDDMVAETFGDHLGSTNPRYSLMEELRRMFRNAYDGIIL